MQTLPSEAAPAAAGRPWTWARALGVVVGIEVGLLLLTLPWTPLWSHNLWVQQLRARHSGLLGPLLSSYARGAVSGLGLINLWIATCEITRFRR